MKTKIFTVGYSGHDPATFLALLKEHGIETLVDVRRRPISRKPGFSKSRLAAQLNGNGVDYAHLQDLGVPDSLRAQLKDGSCTLQKYLDLFRNYLRSHSNAVRELYNLALAGPCCLLCVEAKPAECHRSVVADELVALNGRAFEVVHLCCSHGLSAKP